MKRNIFVTNIFGHDISMAEAFLDGGDIIPVTEGRINIFKTDSLERKIKGVIDKQMSRDDLVLIAGNAVVASMVCAYVAHEFGEINILIWNNTDREYFERTINYEGK